MIATLKTLAAELGISPPAVSMALRNHPRISESTRRRVKALAKQRGYVPNPAFRRSGGLRPRKGTAGMPLALLWQKHPQAGFGISTCFKTIKNLAESFGYHLQEHQVTEENAARISGILYSRGVEAVLIGRIYSSSFAQQFEWKQFSVVALDAGYYALPCHTVLPDIGRTTVEAVRKVLQAGFRRVGLYEFREEVEPTDWIDRIGAASLAAQLCAQHSAQFFHYLGPPYDESLFLSWVQETRPDVVIGQTPACYWWLKKHFSGGSCPWSVSLQLDPAEKAFGMPGFVHDNSALASVALKLLDSEVRNFERGKPPIPTRLLVAMPWFAGTLRPPKKKSGQTS